MEIKNYSSAINAYKFNSTYDGVKKTAAQAVPKNVDVVEFSSSSKKRSIDKTKAEIKSSVIKGASEERIASLRQMISEGSYCVSAESVAAAILEG